MANKLTKKNKVLLALSLVAIILVGAVVSLVVVLAAQSQDLKSSINVNYTSNEVAGEIKFSYKLATGEYSEAKTITFDGSEQTASGALLSPNDDIYLTTVDNYAIFRYEITGLSEAGYYMSMEYIDRYDADTNSSIEYIVSDVPVDNFSNMTLTSSVGTITANNKQEDGEKIYLYVKAKVVDFEVDMNYNGDFYLILSREEWADPNYDAATGISYGYVDNNGSPYAAAVGYDGTSTDLNINSTSVYGSELPVVAVKDYAFSASTAAATSTLLTKVTAGDNVTLIEGYAFANNVVLAEAVLGENLTRVAKTAFYNCPLLMKVTNNSLSVLITPTEYGLPEDAVIKNAGVSTVEIKKDTVSGFRDYYYVEMGEYPQTFAGYDSNVTGLTATGETINIDLSGTYGYTRGTDGTYTASTGYGTSSNEFAIYTTSTGERVIKHKAYTYSTSNKYLNGSTTTNVEAWFKLEPIKWDVVGYYNDDSKSSFTKVTDSGFDPTHTENLVVQSRTALQGMVWNTEYTDVDYNNSTIYKWLQTFYARVLEADYDDNIETVTNQYMDTSANTSISGTTMAGSVTEKAWLFDYTQANSTFFSGSTERLCSPSDFALGTYAYLYTSTSYKTITRQSGGTCYYWLRSSFYNSGSDLFYAGHVYYFGNVTTSYVNYFNSAVRPALLVNL